MLDTKADGERFRFDIDTFIMQHLEGIARAVTDGQHDMVGGDMLATRQHHALHSAFAVSLFNREIGHAGFKPVFASQLLNRTAHILDHFHQPEGADMWMRFGEDLWRSFCLHKFGEYFAAQMPWIFDLAVELAVGKRTRAALAILHVRFGIEHRFAPQAPGIFGAFAHDFAALQNDWFEAHLRQ